MEITPPSELPGRFSQMAIRKDCLPWRSFFSVQSGDGNDGRGSKLPAARSLYRVCGAQSRKWRASHPRILKSPLEMGLVRRECCRTRYRLGDATESAHGFGVASWG